MIRFALILLLSLTTPAFAQQKEAKTDPKPVTSQEKVEQKPKPKKQNDQNETKLNESNSTQDKDSKETTGEEDSENEEEKTEPTNTAMLAGALKFRSVGPAFMSGRIGDIAIDQKKTQHVVCRRCFRWTLENHQRRDDF